MFLVQIPGLITAPPPDVKEILSLNGINSCTGVSIQLHMKDIGEVTQLVSNKIDLHGKTYPVEFRDHEIDQLNDRIEELQNELGMLRAEVDYVQYMYAESQSELKRNLSYN
mgnify:CR=1 FL=1